MDINKLAIIAGEGELPRLIAKQALEQGIQVYTVTYNHKARSDLDNIYTDNLTTSIMQLQAIIDFLYKHNVQDIICIGKFHKLDILRGLPTADSLTRKYLRKLINLEDNTVHKLIEDSLQDYNLKLIPQSYFLRPYFASIREYTDRELSQEEQDDLDYGKLKALEFARLEIGQTIIVKNQSIMALEAIEGTDEAIKRGCQYAKNNGVIIKVPWSKQSCYFDLPTIGPKTLKTIIKNKGSVLAIKAYETFIVNEAECIRLAKKHNIKLLSF